MPLHLDLRFVTLIYISTFVLINAKPFSISELLKSGSSESNIPQEFSASMSVFWSEFSYFKTQYNKIYKSQEEEAIRFANFIGSVIKINKHNDLYNQGLMKYKMAINHMSDLKEEEIFSVNLFSEFNSTGSTYLSSSVKLDIPESIDWREKGAVTEVKTQGNCNSCYAISAAGSLEAQIWKKTGKLTSLSAQQIVDCDESNAQCDGGLMDLVFTYIKNTGGIEAEKDYPYISGITTKPNNECRFDKKLVAAHATGFVRLPESEETIKEAVATIGPIVIGMHSDENVKHYSHGIFHGENCKNSDVFHAVLIVGYGTEEATGTPYWIIKNSWGPNWGENGYMRMERNKNICNVTMYPVYPLV